MKKLPTKAMLKLGVNKVFPIAHIWFNTQDVTLQEKPNVLNTVSFNDVEFID
jgi:hypothetical protein